MATRRGRGSARRAREPDFEDEDDFAWQTPDKPKKKKKKKKKKTGTGSTRRKAGTSGRSSSTRSSGKSTGKKRRGSSAMNPKASSAIKKSSARRKKSRRASGDDDDFDGNASGRRRRAPPPRKKGVDPIIPISIVTGSLLLCGGIFFISSRKSNVVVRDEEAIFSKGKQYLKEGREAYAAWAKAKRANNSSLEDAKAKEARMKLEKARDTFEEALKDYRDKDGMLKKGYDGYDSIFQEIGTLLVDIEKGSRVH